MDSEDKVDYKYNRLASQSEAKNYCEQVKIPYGSQSLQKHKCSRNFVKILEISEFQESEKTL